MEMFPQNSWKVIDQWLQLFQPLLIWVCLMKTTCRISIFPTGYMYRYYNTSCRNSIRLFNVSEIPIRKTFSTLHGYTCSDTVNTIVIFENIVVLKTNYLHIQNGFLKVLLPLFLFSQTLTYLHVVTCILIFLSYQISSPVMHIYFGVTLNRVACLCWEGRSYQLLGNIAHHKDEPDGYLTNHVTYDNLEAIYCTFLLTVWHGKIIFKIDFHHENHNYLCSIVISCTISVSRIR